MTMTEEINDLNTKSQINANKTNEQLYEKKTKVKLENVSVHVIMVHMLSAYQYHQKLC